VEHYLVKQHSATEKKHNKLDITTLPNSRSMYSQKHRLTQRKLNVRCEKEKNSRNGWKSDKVARATTFNLRQNLLPRKTLTYSLQTPHTDWHWNGQQQDTAQNSLTENTMGDFTTSTFAESIHRAKPERSTVLRPVLRPNCSSANLLSESLSQKVKSANGW